MKMLTNVRGLASISGWHVAIVALAFLVVIGTAMGGVADEACAPSAQAGLESGEVPDGPPPAIDDPVSDGELRLLQMVACQKGMSLQAAIERYAWNDNFSLAATLIREAFPAAFTGAEIVDAHNAWIAFKGPVPGGAREMIDPFTSSYPRVAVEMRTDMGFAEVELRRGIEKVHFAVYQRPEVRDAVTGYDFATGKITTTVVLEDTASSSALDDLQVLAGQSLIEATREDILNSIRVSVVRPIVPVSRLSWFESNSEHLGGEELSGDMDCTTAFGTKTSSGQRGIATAGHCNGTLRDDGYNLAYQSQYTGNLGDFEWRTGAATYTDDFYAGSTYVTETNRTDVSSVGSPSVGQTLCRNGKTSQADCQEVRAVEKCWDGICNLVQMGQHLSAPGDSGGPVYWYGTVYGIHQGAMWDPFPPFDREVFSRADLIDDALGIVVATD